MGKNRGYEDLNVWHKSIDFADEIYSLTVSFPKEEVYGLSSQLRRASVSIASNIAEGCARNSYKEFVQFLGIATGSLAEVHTQLILAERRHYLSRDHFMDFKEKLDELRRMLNALKASLRAPDHFEPAAPVTKLVTRNS